MSKFKMSKMVNVFISAVIILTLFVYSSPIVAMASMQIDEDYSVQVGEETIYGDEFVEVFSYKTILREKYDAKVLSGDLDQSEVSFSEFCDSYVDSNLAIDQVTADSVEGYQQVLENQVQPRSSFIDENYILIGASNPNSHLFDP